MPTLDWEIQAGHPRYCVVGVDEVGRGCLAGPVVAAAVALPEKVDLAEPWIAEINDSKLIKAERRSLLAEKIRIWAHACAIGVASVEEIDQINIFQASQLAMRRALIALPIRAHHVLIDGKFKLREVDSPSTAIIKGDQHCLSIACASIIAKVWRDQLMVAHDVHYPGYGFASHKGYGTPAHLAALAERGVSALHRNSFAPVRNSRMLHESTAVTPPTAEVSS